MTPRNSRGATRWLLAALTGWWGAAALFAQGGLPAVQLSRTDDGRLRLQTTGATTGLALEQTDSLTPPIRWISAPLAPDGSVDPAGETRFFRWRRLGAAAPVVSTWLEFSEPPAQARPGEPVQFEFDPLAAVLGEVTWRVNGVTGGDAEAGFISATGLFQAPSTTGQRTVEITAEQTLADGTLAQARAQLTVQAMPLPTGERRLPAATGGAVVSVDGRARLTVPPGAVAADATWSVTAVPARELAAFDGEDRDALAVLSLAPDGVAFARPVRVEFPLDRRATPGELLPLFVERIGVAGASWVAADLAAVVLADGFTAASELPHFSRWSVLRPRPLLPVAPVAPTVTSVEPASLREGELRPLLLRGSDFNNVTRVEIFDGSLLALAPTPLMEVRQFAYEPATPGEFGVLVKSLPNPRQPGFTNLTYRLRLTVRTGVFRDVPITVTGLDEFVLAPGQSFTIPANPVTNRATFSRIEIGAGAHLATLARVLAWQATDSVELRGTVTAAGPAGPAAQVAQPGAMPEPDRSRTGAGDGRPAVVGAVPPGLRPDGQPLRTVNLNDYLPGAFGRIFGLAGANGAAGENEAGELEAYGEGMYALFGRQLSALRAQSSLGVYDLGRDLAEDLVSDHPEGRKGHQGVPGGLVIRAPRSGFFAGQRQIAPGGGGGGGGGSFRVGDLDRNREFIVGLGGGAGGGGGGAISLVAGEAVTVGTNAVVDTSGGNGGNGGQPVGHNYTENPGIPRSRGGGGGPGGAGTIHVLAGERLVAEPGVWPLRHRAGEWGEGGFLMTVQSHDLASPPSWRVPIPELPSSAQGELAGPDFSAINLGLRTGIQLNRGVEARALNSREQEVSVRIFNRLGIRTNFVRGVSAGSRTVRFVLAPGTNRVVITSLADHGVLNREIVVLDSPNADGDCLTDAEEAVLGFDPNARDTDGDGIDDCDEFLAGGSAVPGDEDHDGVPTVTELAEGSDPNDISSTPWNANLGTGARRGIIVATPHTPRVIRPQFTGAQAVGAAVTGSLPQDVRVIRPGFGTTAGLLPVAVANPQTPRVIRPGFGTGSGSPVAVATPHRLPVVRPAFGLAAGVPPGPMVADPQAVFVRRQ
jgi:hypothetical protein